MSNKDQVEESYLNIKEPARKLYKNEIQISGLEGEYSKTFVKESKSNTSLFIVNSKVRPNVLSRKTSEKTSIVKTASKSKFEKQSSQGRIQTTEGSEISPTKAKPNNMYRKKILNKKPKNTVRLASNFNQENKKGNISHRKAISIAEP